MNEWSNEQLEEMFGDDIIEKLAFLAGCKTHRAVNFENIPDGYIVTDEAFTKFAELIVRECAELSVNSQYANTKSEYYEGFNEALIYAGNKIKQHFGVEW